VKGIIDFNADTHLKKETLSSGNTHTQVSSGDQVSFEEPAGEMATKQSKEALACQQKMTRNQTMNTNKLKQTKRQHPESLVQQNKLRNQKRVLNT
jgi:hypothetical protein